MKNYTVKCDIGLIDLICENPKRYKNLIQAAINDAKVHYENGNASKQWYDYVVKRLSECKKKYNF